MTPRTLERDEVYIDGDERRVYVDVANPADEWMCLSVSTICGFRDDEGKDAAINGWKETFSGDHGQSWTFPHYEEQRTYKSCRGTLGHWAICSSLADVPKTADEREAEHTLKHWADERPAVTDDDVTMQRGIDPHTYRGQQAWSRCMRDLNWAIEQFGPLAATLDVTSETVIAAENYLDHDDPNYAGQFDVLFDPPDGPTTLVDLKFSSGVRYVHKLQLAAYRHALLADDAYPDTIPRVMAIRLYPDDEEVEVSTNTLDDETAATLDEMDVDTTIWSTSVDSYTDEFLDLVADATDEWLTQVTFDEMLTRLDGQ